MINILISYIISDEIHPFKYQNVLNRCLNNFVDFLNFVYHMHKNKSINYQNNLISLIIDCTVTTHSNDI